MRISKWISILLTTCLILCMLPCALAEEDILSAPVEKAVEEADTFSLGELYAEEDFVLHDDAIEPEAPAPAVEAAVDGDFVIDEYGTLTKYIGFDKDVLIPNGVTKIGESVFEGFEDIESVIIPNGVTSIGDSAFSWCSNLKNIYIPNSVTTFGWRVFYQCSKPPKLPLISLPRWFGPPPTPPSLQSIKTER